MTAAPGLPSSPSIFPRAYLLGIYTAAIEQGFVWINGLRAADAPSLKARLLRLRRRSDTANKSFITPNHYLVTFGDWEEVEPGSGIGRMAAMFDAVPPDLGYTLPTLSLHDGSPLPEEASLPPSFPVSDFGTTDLSVPDLSPASLDDYVARMISNAASRTETEDD